MEKQRKINLRDGPHKNNPFTLDVRACFMQLLSFDGSAQQVLTGIVDLSLLGFVGFYALLIGRRGGATFAFRAGVQVELIRLQGDWRSDAYLLYLKVPLRTRLELSGNRNTRASTRSKTTKWWNVPASKLPADETLHTDYDDCAKTSPCDTKFATTTDRITIWIDVCKMRYNEEYGKQKWSKSGVETDELCGGPSHHGTENNKRKRRRRQPTQRVYVFDEMAEKLKKHGVFKTGEQCRTKMTNLHNKLKKALKMLPKLFKGTGAPPVPVEETLLVMLSWHRSPRKDQPTGRGHAGGSGDRDASVCTAEEYWADTNMRDFQHANTECWSMGAPLPLAGASLNTRQGVKHPRGGHQTTRRELSTGVTAEQAAEEAACSAGGATYSIEAFRKTPWLGKFAECYGDKMPDKEAVNLPSSMTKDREYDEYRKASSPGAYPDNVVWDLGLWSSTNARLHRSKRLC
ncbi:hypothetical protein Bbelb_051420 [Branchiostoma belcheri]|nr:hypothetical protein Bbelb_051420 [Branchiostoma belcheri]